MGPSRLAVSVYEAYFGWRRRLEAARVPRPPQPGPFEPDKIDRALLVCTGLIGDTVMCLPAIRAAKDLLPRAELVGLVTESTHLLLRLTSCLDRFVVCDGAPLRLLPGGRRAARDLEEVLAAERFSMAMIFLGDDYAPMLTRMGVPHRIFVAESAYGPLATATYRIGAPESWGPAQRLGAWKTLGLDPVLQFPRLQPPSAAAAAVERRIGGLPRPWFVLHPFGRIVDKWWPRAHAEACSRALRDQFGGTVFAVGGKREAEAFHPTPGEMVDLVGQLSLDELVALIGSSDFVVSTDSGPYHVAGAMGRPGAGLFRASRPEHSTRYATMAGIVAPRIAECAVGCTGDRCRVTPCHQMAALSPDAVVAAARAILPPMIRVLHFADLINRDDFIHTALSHVDAREFVMSAATLTARGTLNSDPSPLPLVHNLEGAHRRHYAAAAWRLRRLLARTGVDVLHAHHYEPAILGTAATWASRVPFIIGRHYSDAIYQLSHGCRRRAYLAMEALCNRWAAAIVAPSRAVARVLRKQGVDPGKVEVIPYGFDLRRFGPRDPTIVARVRSEEWPPGDGPRLVTVARLHPEKGHRYLIDALETLRREKLEARWLIVGDGPERGPLEAEIGTKGLRGLVRFAGWRTDVLDLIAGADIVVQPTLHEAFSQAMVEAMALGTPLVISDVSGVEDLVEPGQSGIVVPARDGNALAAAIRELCDRGRAQSIGHHAQARVRSLLDVEVVARQLENLYRRVAASGRAPR